MSADLLRRAAKTLREVAASCEPGDWIAELGETGTAWVNLPAYPHAWGMHGFAEEARHVAQVSPAVSMALSELLSMLADIGEGYGYDCRAAERVARAILREQP